MVAMMFGDFVILISFDNRIFPGIIIRNKKEWKKILNEK